MNAHTTPTPQVQVTIQGKESFRNFRNDRDLVFILRELLASCGYKGTFTATIIARLKGSAHTNGLQLGAPQLMRRSVELQWQAGGNDKRFSLMLNTPEGVEPIEFHAVLDKALQNNSKATAPGKVVASASQSSALSVDDAELLLREILPHVTEAGVIVRQQCVEVLARVNRSNTENDIQALIADGYMSPGKTAAFIMITQVWLQKLRQSEPSSAMQERQAAVQNEAPKAVTSSAQELLAEVARLTSIVDKSHQAQSERSGLLLQQTELEGVIATANTQLQEVNKKLQEADTILADPDLQLAQTTLQSLRALLTAQ